MLSTKILCVVFGLVLPAIVSGLGDVTEAGERLANLINDEREAGGLNRIPLSTTMMTVGQKHVDNIQYAYLTGIWNNAAYYHCNIHTWFWGPESNTPPESGIAPPGESYQPCCYEINYSNCPPSGHCDPECMWLKTRQITQGSDWTSEGGLYYYDYGFEIAATGFASVESAVTGWMGSSLHRDVIMNEGGWSSQTFLALGCGALEAGDSSGYVPAYFCWFSRITDPNGFDSVLVPPTPSPSVPVVYPKCCKGRRRDYNKKCKKNVYQGNPGPNTDADLCNNFEYNEMMICWWQC